MRLLFCRHAGALVDDDHAWRGKSLNIMAMEQQAVPSEALELAVDGGWRDAQVVGDLAVGHAADGHGHELGKDIGTFQVVGRREGL